MGLSLQRFLMFCLNPFLFVLLHQHSLLLDELFVLQFLLSSQFLRLLLS